MGMVGGFIGTYSTFGSRVVYFFFFERFFGVLLHERGCIRCNFYILFGGDNGGYFLTKGVAVGYTYYCAYNFCGVAGEDQIGIFFRGLYFTYEWCFF